MVGGGVCKRSDMTFCSLISWELTFTLFVFSHFPFIICLFIYIFYILSFIHYISSICFIFIHSFFFLSFFLSRISFHILFRYFLMFVCSYWCYFTVDLTISMPELKFKKYVTTYSIWWEPLSNSDLHEFFIRIHKVNSLLIPLKWVPHSLSQMQRKVNELPAIMLRTNLWISTRLGICRHVIMGAHHHHIYYYPRL